MASTLKIRLIPFGKEFQWSGLYLFFSVSFATTQSIRVTVGRQRCTLNLCSVRVLGCSVFCFLLFHQVNINESLQQQNIFLHIVRAVHLFVSTKTLSHRVVTWCYCCSHRRCRRRHSSASSVKRGGKLFDEFAVFQRKYIFIPLAMFGKDSALTLSIETFRIKYEILYYWWILFVVINTIFSFFCPPPPLYLSHTHSLCVSWHNLQFVCFPHYPFLFRNIYCVIIILWQLTAHTKSKNLAVRWKETLEHYSKKTDFFMLIFRLS